MSRDSNIDIFNLLKYLDLLVDSNIPYHSRETIDSNGPFYFKYKDKINIDKMVNEGINSIGLLNVISNRFCLKIPDNGTTWSDYLSNKKSINENQEYEKGTLLLGEHNNVGIVHSSNGNLKNSIIVFVNSKSKITKGKYNSHDFKYALLPRNWFF